MIVVATGFVKGKAVQAKLKSHLKYLVYRPRSPEEKRIDRSLFSKDRSSVPIKEAYEEILQHQSEVGFHKLVLSPSCEEYISDWQQWTRAVMSEWETYKHQSLHWYATIHRNTDNPHVHVVVAGSGEDSAGRAKAVRVSRQDLSFLKTCAHEHSTSDLSVREQTIARQILKELEQEEAEMQAFTRQIREKRKTSREVGR
ncbi:relaxase MobL [Thermogemmatispora sp.]|jgi:type IV secretory pathway VirD2 relaxase|uniref:relaxase MobL n=1 Tax=Thermogemmatispora sp. TaxID=1968838 RepID=UPI0035E447FB